MELPAAHHAMVFLKWPDESYWRGASPDITDKGGFLCRNHGGTSVADAMP